MTFNSTLKVPTVENLLDQLFQKAADSDPSILEAIFANAEDAGGVSNDSEVSDQLANAYIPISRELGRLLYLLVRAQGSRRVIEFGTSFGISTIYLASAIRDNGGGRVITTEMNPAKVRAARQNLNKAGLGDLVEILEGDALITLREIDGPIDLLLLDGWKNLYLPVLRLVEPHLRTGALIIADDLNVFPEAHQPYLNYVRSRENDYLSVEIPLGDHIEVSMSIRPSQFAV